MPFHIQAFRNRNKVRSGMAASPHLHYSSVLYHTSQRITLFLWQHFSNFALALLFFYPNFRGPFLHSRSSQFEKFDSLILYLKKLLIFWHIGRNHVHLTERFGFVNRHLWLGNFGKRNRGLHARTLRLRYPNCSVTSPLS